MSALPWECRPWHKGETEARRRAGAPEIASVIRPFMSEPLRDFFLRLPLVFVAGLDAKARPTASLLRGAPGFVACPDAESLDVAAAFPDGDPLSETTRPGAPFGLIGLDFLARRRNRVNGRIISAAREGLSLRVDEAFGNCPKYIFPREIFASQGPPGAWSPLPCLGAAEKALIARADVFFVATRGPDGVDISHRGGKPGFVEIAGDSSLRVPDYRGNNYFNTFGNLLHDPSGSAAVRRFRRGSGPASPGRGARRLFRRAAVLDFHSRRRADPAMRNAFRDRGAGGGARGMMARWPRRKQELKRIARVCFQ